ncbi:DUF262 domain-containing protein [Lachnospiraceae bacterium WCA-9-b2]|jgi:hypothetical protein|uniref:DUF262 domain-containing protein n=1 Tax=Sporofaciens musculi TaxID=2681861 RepID=A0A7X3MKB1_9FIRM|nr:DUF262 domain-containing protein [Sporofaciens musculi]MXP77991.1 DUF262 domain-containing protein [Sporofaciens musculi]
MQEISSQIKKEIEDFAKENNNEISLFAVSDILNNKTAGIDEDLLNHTLDQLRKEGIKLLPLDMDEGYKADMNEPDQFIPSDVNITQIPTNISNIMERLENEEFDLTPVFQRHGGLWSKEEQSQLIESLMLKIPLPAFYFDAAREDKWIVIDGLQRLTSFQNYLVGNMQENGLRKKYCFTGLQYLSDFNGMTFDDLPRQYIRRIKESSIIAYTVIKGTPDEVVFNIFQRINTGGIQLNAQEIRQALYSGKGTDLIKELAELQEFKEATQFAVKPERMLDREYVLRFLAFTELDYKKEYKGNINNFLIKGLKKANTFREEDIERVTERFIRVMNVCRNVFGKYAFRKYNKNFRRGPINKAIFEIWAICFSELDDNQLQKIVRNKDKFINQFGELLLKTEFAMTLKAGDQYSFIKRIGMTREFVEGFLCLEN